MRLPIRSSERMVRSFLPPVQGANYSVDHLAVPGQLGKHTGAVAAAWPSLERSEGFQDG